MQTVNVTKDILVPALKADFRDFEDGVHYFSARKVDNITALMRHNKRDFKTALIPIYQVKNFNSPYFIANKIIWN